MILNQDYKFRDDIKEDTVPIELLIAPFTGIIYRYVRLDLSTLTENDPRIKFDYKFIELNGFREKALRKDEKFNRLIGIILNTLIIDTMEIEGQVEPKDETVEHD